MPGKSNLVSIWIVHSNNPSAHGRPLLITSTFESFHVLKYFISEFIHNKILFPINMYLLSRLNNKSTKFLIRNGLKKRILTLRVNPVISTESTHQNIMEGVTHYLVIFASLANHFSCRSRKMSKNI